MIRLSVTSFTGAALMASLLLPLSAGAAGNARQPNICTRACWGAASATGITYMSSLTRAIVHHTAGNEFNTTGLEASKANVRAIQNLHKNTNGWGDIGYHFLVDKFGNTFEGRHGSMSSLPRGAHDGTNTNSFGFNLMGYFHPNVNNVPTAAMMNAMYDVIAWRMPAAWRPYGSPGVYGPLGLNVGYLDAHRRVKSTACPGDHVFNPYMGSNVNAGTMRAEVQKRIDGVTTPVAAFAAPSVVTYPDGRMVAFAVARSNGSVWHSWQSTVGGSFGSWVSLGGSGFTKVKAFFQPGTTDIIVYGIGPNTPLWHNWQVGGAWSGWASLGGTITDFDVVYGTNNLPVAFAVSAGSVWHNWQPSAGAGWNGWVSLGGSGFTQVQGFRNSNGTFTVFGCGPNTPLQHCWQSAVGGTYNSWVSLGGSINSFEVVASSAGLPVAYATGADSAVHTNWQPAANASWNGWVSLGGTGFTKIDAVTMAGGAGLVFGTGGSGEVWHKWQSAAGSPWSAWTSLGGSLQTLCGLQHPNGALLTFGHGLNNTSLWHRWQTGSGWSAWTAIGSNL